MTQQRGERERRILQEAQGQRERQRRRAGPPAPPAPPTPQRPLVAQPSPITKSEQARYLLDAFLDLFPSAARPGVGANVGISPRLERAIGLAAEGKYQEAEALDWRITPLLRKVYPGLEVVRRVYYPQVVDQWKSRFGYMPTDEQARLLRGTLELQLFPRGMVEPDEIPEYPADPLGAVDIIAMFGASQQGPTAPLPGPPAPTDPILPDETLTGQFQRYLGRVVTDRERDALAQVELAIETRDEKAYREIASMPFAVVGFLHATGTARFVEFIGSLDENLRYQVERAIDESPLLDETNRVAFLAKSKSIVDGLSHELVRRPALYRFGVEGAAASYVATYLTGALRVKPEVPAAQAIRDAIKQRWAQKVSESGTWQGSGRLKKPSEGDLDELVASIQSQLNRLVYRDSGDSVGDIVSGLIFSLPPAPLTAEAVNGVIERAFGTFAAAVTPAAVADETALTHALNALVLERVKEAKNYDLLGFTATHGKLNAAEFIQQAGEALGRGADSDAVVNAALDLMLMRVPKDLAGDVRFQLGQRASVAAREEQERAGAAIKQTLSSLSGAENLDLLLEAAGKNEQAAASAIAKAQTALGRGATADQIVNEAIRIAQVGAAPEATAGVQQRLVQRRAQAVTDWEKAFLAGTPGLAQLQQAATATGTTTQAMLTPFLDEIKSGVLTKQQAIERAIERAVGAGADKGLLDQAKAEQEQFQTAQDTALAESVADDREYQILQAAAKALKVTPGQLLAEVHRTQATVRPIEGAQRVPPVRAALSLALTKGGLPKPVENAIRSGIPLGATLEEAMQEFGASAEEAKRQADALAAATGQVPLNLLAAQRKPALFAQTLTSLQEAQVKGNMGVVERFGRPISELLPFELVQHARDEADKIIQQEQSEAAQVAARTVGPERPQPARPVIRTRVRR